MIIKIKLIQTSIKAKLTQGVEGVVIRDLAEIECVIREYRKNLTVIREFCIGCEAGFLWLLVYL